jgi:hypothetical protein
MIPGQSMWDLWWTKWHWDRFFPEYFGVPLSVSFHWCSVTRENEKKIIFITGLHSKPQGCGASVASAAGLFTTKETYYKYLLTLVYLKLYLLLLLLIIIIIIVTVILVILMNGFR